MVFRVVLLIALLLLSALPAQGQLPEPQWSLEVTEGAVPITPVGETASRPYTITLVCETGTVRTSADPIRVDVSASTDVDWASVTIGTPSHDVNATQDACAAGTEVPVEGVVAVAVSNEAPAGTRFTVTLTATPSEGAVVSKTWNETAGAYLKAQARFQQAIWKAPPSSDVRIPLVIENLGNGPVRAVAKLGGGEPAFTNITLPEEFEVLPGETVTKEVTVFTPAAGGYINRRDHLNIEVQVTSIDDSSQSTEQGLTAVVQTQGTDIAEGPAPAPLVLLGLIALLGLRRRD